MRSATKNGGARRTNQHAKPVWRSSGAPIFGTYLCAGVCAGDLLRVDHDPCEINGEIVVAVGTFVSESPPKGFGFGDMLIVQHEKKVLELALSPSWLRPTGRRKASKPARATARKPRRAGGRLIPANERAYNEVFG